MFLLPRGGRYKFAADLSIALPHSILSHATAEELTLYRHLRAGELNQEYTNTTPESLASFLARLPAVSKHTLPMKPKPPKPLAEDEEIPGWLLDHPLPHCAGGRAIVRQDGGHSSPGESESPRGSDNLNGSEEVMELEGDLEAIRAAIQADQATRTKDFKVVPVVSTQDQAATGQAVLAIQGIACGDMAERFCKQQHVHKSSFYKISVYGEANCGILARAWIHKMQYFMDIARVRGLGSNFTEAESHGYQAPQEVLVIDHELAVEADRRLASRLRHIQQLFQ